MIRVAADHGVILELAEAEREAHMLSARDVLVAQEQHLVLEQRGPDLGEQAIVVHGVCQVHVH